MKLSVLSKKAVIDPVCGMQVDPCNSKLISEYKDKRFYFCAHECRRAFEKDPEKYKETISTEKKGLWGRYLARLNKTTDGKAIKCH
jgi:YHS domain-containing protein